MESILMGVVWIVPSAIATMILCSLFVSVVRVLIEAQSIINMWAISNHIKKKNCRIAIQTQCRLSKHDAYLFHLDSPRVVLIVDEKWTMYTMKDSPLVELYGGPIIKLIDGVFDDTDDIITKSTIIIPNGVSVPFDYIFPFFAKRFVKMIEGQITPAKQFLEM